MDDFEVELKKDFLEESLSMIDNCETSFLALDKNPGDSGLIDQIFRLAHSLKGTSRAVGFAQIAELTHIAENLLLKIKNKEIELNPHIVSTLLEFNDRVKLMVETLRADLGAEFQNHDLIGKIEDHINGKAVSSASTHPNTIAENAPIESFEEANFANFEQSPPEPIMEAEQVNSIETSPVDQTEMSEAALESMRELGFSFDTNEKKEVPKMAPVLELKKEVASPAPKTEKAPSSPAQPADESIRVALSKIEKLNNLVGEFVILQTVLEQRRFIHIQDELSVKSITQLSKISKEIQDISMSLRMIPLKQTFQKLSRTIRDTALALGKDVELTIDGENTEIDKTVLEKLADPLVHIVRNAVDHGLEIGADRTQKGKSPKGNIKIAAYHEGSNMVIKVTDDGKGIDPNVLKKKAKEKGLNVNVATMTDAQAINLIFHAGFSTKEQVTEVSGRGVGMDVVKTNIEIIGGKVDVSSTVGSGSEFKIVLPLTLAIIDAFVVEAKPERFVLPVTHVRESLILRSQDVKYLTGVGNVLNLRDEVLPLYSLSQMFGSQKAKFDPGQTVIIYHNYGDPFAVAVDSIIQQQQVVIKKIGQEIKQKEGLMGACILGDGRPTFILDLIEVIGNKIKQSKNRTIQPGLAA